MRILVLSVWVAHFLLAPARAMCATLLFGEFTCRETPSFAEGSPARILSSSKKLDSLALVPAKIYADEYSSDKTNPVPRVPVLLELTSVRCRSIFFL